MQEKETEIKQANEKVSETKVTIKIRQVYVIITGDCLLNIIRWFKEAFSSRC